MNRLCALLGFLAASTASGQEVDAARHSWGKIKPGTKVTYKISNQSGGKEFGGFVSILELKEATDRGSTFKEIIDKRGEKTESEWTESAPKKIGEERLKVAGKEYGCAIWQWRVKFSESEREIRVWLADSVRAPLKIFYNYKEDEQDGGHVAVKLDESLEVGGKKYECVRLERDPGADGKSILWLSGDVPGWTVKTYLELGGFVITKELTEVAIKK
jgi:hypothetical protein